MTIATPSKQAKAIRQPTCKHCKTRFRTTSITKKFCTAVCQTEAANLKRRISYTYKATNSAFFYHLAYEAERAGTLEIFRGHTVESLVALYEIYKLCLKANYYGDNKDFELSHIYSVKGNSNIGLFHADNLVIAPLHMNREHGTKHYGYGLSIAKSACKPKHAVAKTDNRKATVGRVIKYLGETIVSGAVKIAKIQPTQRHKVLSWLHDHLDTSFPEHQAHLNNIDSMSGTALTALKASLQGKEVNTFSGKPSNHSRLHILYLELQRHCVIRPDLQEVIDLLLQVVNPNFVMHNHRQVLTDAELQLIFDVLHGKEVNSVRAGLIEMVDSHTSIHHRDERIPRYAPIVFNKTKPVVLEVVQAPARVLQTFSSFADVLDNGVISSPTVVLQAHTATYDIDALPWD